jgi:hypothetical protein
MACCPILPVGFNWLLLLPLVTLDELVELSDVPEVPDVPGVPEVPEAPGEVWACAEMTKHPAVNAIMLSSCCLINLPFVVAVVSAKSTPSDAVLKR